MNHFPRAARRGFLSQCVLAVLIAGLVSPHSQRTVLSDGTAAGYLGSVSTPF